MQKKLTILFTLLVMFIATLACASSVGTVQPAKPVNVETIVAMTFQALTAPALQPSTSNLLPHPLYFLNNDNTGIVQVYRLEKDGKALKQITFEPTNVTGYDISPIDGSVAYVSNNQLLNINADGSNRSLLVDGGTIAANDYTGQVTKTVRTPRWSKDGQTIAFGLNGLTFYSIKDGAPNNVLKTQFSTTVPPLMQESYFPESYSPDGTKILITITYMEAGALAIYVPSTGILYKLTRPDGGIVAGTTYWSPDSSSVFVANPTTGMIDSGLWRFNAADGSGTTLIPGNNPDGTYNYADAPLIAPDGQLYFLFNNLPDAVSQHTPMQLVRSGVDGVTGRTVIGKEIFTLINESLWSPDGSFVIVTYAPIQDVYEGGQAEMVYVDGRPNVVLAPYATSLRWGP